MRGRSQGEGTAGGKEKGGNMWEGASHMETGCCQAGGREAVLSLSLVCRHTHGDFQEPFESFISCDGEESKGNSCGLYLYKGQRTDVHRNKAGWKVSTMHYSDSNVVNLVNLWLYELMLESCNG